MTNLHCVQYHELREVGVDIVKHLLKEAADSDPERSFTL